MNRSFLRILCKIALVYVMENPIISKSGFTEKTQEEIILTEEKEEKKEVLETAAEESNSAGEEIREELKEVRNEAEETVQEAKEEIKEEIREEIKTSSFDDEPDEEDLSFSEEDHIFSRIRDEDLMRYLEMKHEKYQMEHEMKLSREKKAFTLIQLFISLAAVVMVVNLLKDNPVILVNILYIIGIIIVLWILKNPREK